MKVTIYEYAKCGTCRGAVKWLKANGYEVLTIPLFDTPPTKKQLKILIRMSQLPIKKFFNVSGDVYRGMGLKDKLLHMSEDEMLDLLASNGRLIKRPIVTDGTKVTIGFKEEQYNAIWGNVIETTGEEK